MKIVEFALFPTSFGEDVSGTDPILDAWHAIEKVNGMAHSHGPKRRIGHIRPMDGRMKHHSAGHGHDCLDGSFRSAVVMVSTGSRESDDLGEISKFGCKSHQGESRTVICQVRLGHDSVISAHQLEIIFHIDCLMCVQTCLELDVDITGGMIHQQTTTRKHLQISCLATRSKETAFGAADEVVHCNSLTGNQVVLFQHTLAVTDN